MPLGKKTRIACVVAIVVTGSSLFYVKQRGEDYINQAIADCADAGIVVQEQERNDGILDFKRKYQASIEDPAQMFNSFPATADVVVSPLYNDFIKGNTFSIDLNYMPWTMAGNVDVLFNSPSENLVEELSKSPAGPVVIKFLQENGLSLYSEIEKGKLARLGLRDIDFVTEENGAEINVGLHGALATLQGKEKIVSHLGDISFKVIEGAEQFLWSAKGLNHTMDSSRTNFNAHTLFNMESSDFTIQLGDDGKNMDRFHMSFSGVESDTKVETREDALYAKEISSVKNLSFQYEESGTKGELIIEGLNFEGEVADLDKTATEKCITLLQNYTQEDEPALEKALIVLLQAGGHFSLKDFSVSKTVTRVSELGINIETGPMQLTTDVTVAPNTYDPQVAAPFALAENIKASLDFQMLDKDYETIKTLTGMGMMTDGFVVKEDSQAKVSAQYDGKNLIVNGQTLM